MFLYSTFVLLHGVLIRCAQALKDKMAAEGFDASVLDLFDDAGELLPEDQRPAARGSLTAGGRGGRGRGRGEIPGRGGGAAAGGSAPVVAPLGRGKGEGRGAGRGVGLGGRGRGRGVGGEGAEGRTSNGPGGE